MDARSVMRHSGMRRIAVRVGAGRYRRSVDERRPLDPVTMTQPIPGNGRGKKPPFPGIDSWPNAQSNAPQAWHCGAVPARALKYPRNHFEGGDNFCGSAKRKRGSFTPARAANSPGVR